MLQVFCSRKRERERDREKERERKKKKTRKLTHKSAGPRTHSKTPPTLSCRWRRMACRPGKHYSFDLSSSDDAPCNIPLTSVCQCQCVQVVACLYHCVCLHVPVEVGCEGLRWFQSVCVRAYMYVSVGAYVCGYVCVCVCVHTCIDICAAIRA